MPLFNSRMPANVGMYFQKLMQIAAFDVIETDSFFNMLLRLPPTNPVNEQFQALGFESVYFINNMGSIFLVFLSLLILMIVYAILSRYDDRSSRLEKTLRKLESYLFWDSQLQFLLESYMIITVCCMISLKHSLSFSTFGIAVQTMACLIFFSAIVVVPVVLFRHLMINFQLLDQKQLRVRYEHLYANLKLANGKVVLL